MSARGHGRKTNHVRGDGSFLRKRSPDAGDGCTADYCQPGLLLTAELGQIADIEAGDPGICNGPIAEIEIVEERAQAREDKNMLAGQAMRC
jgi:hypothetical protein